jgi:hypothetical protein
MTSTKVDELPLHYRHDSQPGTLVLTFAMGQNGKIPGHYFWIIQGDDGSIIDKGAVKGIAYLDKVRNDFIYQGWKRFIRPNIKVTDPKKKKEKAKPVEAIVPPPNPQNDQDRAAAFAKLHSKVFDDNSFF